MRRLAQDFLPKAAHLHPGPKVRFGQIVKNPRLGAPYAGKKTAPLRFGAGGRPT